MINREQFIYGSVKIDNPNFSPVNDSFWLINLTIEAGVNGSVVSVDSKLRVDVIGKVINED